ncbi:LppU/SCO3897 family protein [Spirilliplanes yamanashiensis]|uniref:Uncharacterized protein n=1 Tax=Spirilliplanes yamanashiensis TaxID=42233 RepID=A0A8J4DJX5_9ACTN|nr:hypothetical protein [Spirilliplanes yamanashiensis]MDP9816041.1 hypothetical protein [Spirilliplanes yamanashiensis]GIJ04301.1 hypothetical protein Sya03_36530 [Spirilliplanes yamanashiensis]
MTHPVAPPPAESQQGPSPEGAVPPPPPIPGHPGEQKKSGKARILGIVGTILVVLVVIGLKTGLRSVFDSDPLKDAAAGTCVTDTPKAEDTEIVPCGDAKAAFTVAGRVDDVSKAKIDANPNGELCAAYPTAEYTLWSSEEYLLCLAPNKK